jgi:hypothetical protein
MKNFVRLLIGSGENCADIRYATAISTPDDFIYFEYNDRKCAVLSALEIDRAKHRKLTIRHFTENLEEVKD